MKKFASLLFSIFIISSTLLAREISFNKYADKLFTDSAYHAIIKMQCQKSARKSGVEQIHFESNYNLYKDSIISLSKPLIEKKFSELEKKVAVQKTKDKIAIQLFEKSLSNTVAVTLSQNQSLQNALSKRDLNDRIISFDSKIIIRNDGNIAVTETITIANFNDENSNNAIKRGITRDFPTRYTTEKGFFSLVPFNLINITRNGEKENFKTENLSNGIRIYCGRSDYYIEEGIHQYAIQYTTAKQLKFHQLADEFYWNVTGNGWSFSIDKATSKITFPEGASITDLQCYTGLQGEQGRNCNNSNPNRNSITFYTSKKLEPFQGFTVSASIKKGILVQENRLNQTLAFASDNKLIIGLVIFVVLLFISLFMHWLKVGRDPKQGLVIPEFTPPEGLSPADVGYIYHQEYNDKLLSAALIDLAVQKKVQIDVDREGIIFKSNVYKFSAPEKNQNREIPRDYPMYKKYGFDASDLFGITIERGKYNPAFKKISSSFKSHIDANILTENSGNKSKGYLSLNQGYIGLGLLLLILAIIGSFVYLIIIQPPMMIIIYTIAILAVGLIIQIIFMKIIKAYSSEGRMVADKILGFKMYMQTTEKNQLDFLNPPEENIQLFEKYLPYAIALGIENEWSERFKKVVEEAIAGGYQPSYYHMNQHNNSFGSSQSFASVMGSGLSNTVSSASTPPSSSSSGGSSGGGSSGGGGGGGGGGGW